MRYLLDAHALIWFVDQDHLLSPNAHAIMSNSTNDLGNRDQSWFAKITSIDAI